PAAAGSRAGGVCRAGAGGGERAGLYRARRVWRAAGIPGVFWVRGAPSLACDAGELPWLAEGGGRGLCPDVSGSLAVGGGSCRSAAAGAAAGWRGGGREPGVGVYLVPPVRHSRGTHSCAPGVAGYSLGARAAGEAVRGRAWAGA